MFMCTADAPDRPHHQRGLGDAKPGAAIGFRHRDAQPAGFRHRAMEILRETARPVALQPVLRVEALAQLRDRFRDRLLLGGEGEIHGEQG
jgi:hypothetical protein